MTIDFAALFDKSPNPYVILDADLTLVWMNDAYLRATMRERADITGRAMFDAFPSDPASDSFRLLDGSLRRALVTGEPDELALIRYDIARPDGTMDVRYWSATHTPLRSEAGTVAYVLQHTVDVTELHTLRRLRDETGVVRRANAVQARNLDLTAESRRLMDFFEQAPGFVAVLKGPDHRFGMTNHAYCRLVGRNDIVGQRVCDALPEVVDQGFLTILDDVYSTGKPYFGKRDEVALRREQSAPPEVRILNFIFQPMFDDHGTVSGIIIQGYDVTEEVEYEERQTLLINELNHRVKNTLAIVQGLANQSFRPVEAARGAQQNFEARLRALAAAHNLLTESQWRSASVAEIVCGSAEATAGTLAERFTVEGPDVLLEPQTAVSLAMVVHELCTNALKYGALSSDSGGVEVTWTICADDAGDTLSLTWQEEGGPEVSPPQRKGFGRRLIERGLSAHGAGGVKMRFEPRGLVCVIEATLGKALG